MKIPLVHFVAGILIVAHSNLATAEANLVAITSTHSVTETADRIEQLLKDKGLILVVRIDHAAAARKAGLNLADSQVLIFGNPKLGTPLIAANNEIAIDLPLRMLVWSASDGTVHIGYIKPDEILRRYELSGFTALSDRMSGVLAEIADKAGAP